MVEGLQALRRGFCYNQPTNLGLAGDQALNLEKDLGDLEDLEVRYWVGTSLYADVDSADRSRSFVFLCKGYVVDKVESSEKGLDVDVEDLNFG